MKIINDGSRKITSQILSFHTFPQSDVFQKIWEASPWLPEFCELDGVVTPNSGSFYSLNELAHLAITTIHPIILHPPPLVRPIITRFLQNWGTEEVKCDVPKKYGSRGGMTHLSTNTKKTPIFKKQKKWELWGFKTGSGNTVP